MLLVTLSAADHLSRLLAKKGVSPETHGLRLQIQKGGCAGLRWDMQVGERKVDDLVVRAPLGMAVLVDPVSAPYLETCELDYVDTLSEQGFRVQNPRAVRSCGCGTSFEMPAPNVAEIPQGEDCKSPDKFDLIAT